MKVKVLPDGSIEFDVDLSNGHRRQAAELIRDLTADVTSTPTFTPMVVPNVAPKVAETPTPVYQKPRRTRTRSKDLPTDEDVFNYVNGFTRGRTVQQVAEHFGGLNFSTVSHKLSRLHKQGQLRRISRAKYATASVPVPTSTEQDTPSQLYSGNETEIWNYLCENDCTTGVHYTAIANDLRIPTETTRVTLSKVKNKGHAISLGNGYYRADMP